jgi:hypothetical protein
MKPSMPRALLASVVFGSLLGLLFLLSHCQSTSGHSSDPGVQTESVQQQGAPHPTDPLAFRIPPANPPHTTAAIHALVLHMQEMTPLRTLPLGINEDLAKILAGENPFAQPLLKASHPAWSPDRSRLLDPFGTPYHLHALGEGRFELRSAGPDTRLFTSDDEVIQ